MTATILRSACVYSVDNECVTVQERERAKGGNDDEKERKKAAQLPPSLHCIVLRRKLTDALGPRQRQG